MLPTYVIVYSFDEFLLQGVKAALPILASTAGMHSSTNAAPPTLSSTSLVVVAPLVARSRTAALSARECSVPFNH